MEEKPKEPQSANVKIKIVEAIQEFVRENGRWPTQVCLTCEEEGDLLKLTREDCGDLALAFTEKGPRKAIEDAKGKFLTLKVRWDAPSFKVE